MDGIHYSLNVSVVEDAKEAIEEGYNWAAQPDVKPIKITKVVVVRKGTVEGNPTVDLVLENKEGQKYVLIITGRLLRSIPCEDNNV